MRVRWGVFETPSGQTHPQIEVSSSPDHDLFSDAAKVLENGLGARWCEKLDGLDQRYWDLVVGEASITLHIEHYVGIRVFATDGPDANAASVQLLERAFEVLTSTDAKTH